MTARHCFGSSLAGAAALLAALLPAPAGAQAQCDGDSCELRASGQALLAAADRLVAQGRYDEARPLLAALENSPELSMETNFLKGYVAAETGDLAAAVSLFREVLETHPEQTRVRLELGRALMLSGQTSSADHHFRLAEQDDNLPEEVAAMIRTVRGLIRNRRGWHFNVDFGLAPDTNINNATSTQSVDIVAGGVTYPVELADSSRARSGVGQTLGFSGGIKLGLGSDVALALDGSTRFNNYAGGDFDDLSGTFAIGPEFSFNDRSRLTVQAFTGQRFYGWDNAQTSFGLRADFQRTLNRGARLGLAIDGRRVISGFGDRFSGWQAGVYGTYEQVLNRSMLASATLFARTDRLASDAYSNVELGARLGIGGELPFGINAGISGGVSRAMYDAPLALFSSEPRNDWRLDGSVQIGLRSIRVLGFSPSITYSYSRTDSSVSLYRADRHRFQFGLARYF